MIRCRRERAPRWIGSRGLVSIQTAVVYSGDGAPEIVVILSIPTANCCVGTRCVKDSEEPGGIGRTEVARDRQRAERSGILHAHVVGPKKSNFGLGRRPH